MSNLLSGRKKLNKLSEERFENPRTDEFEISAGENKEGDAIIVAMKGRERKILKPTEDKSIIVYDKVRDEIFFEQKDNKPQFIYFMEFTFHNLIPDSTNEIKKIIANVGFIDFIDNHLVFVGETHTEGQSIKVYYSNWDTDSGYDPEQLLFVSKTDGGGDNTHVMERPDPEVYTEDNIYESDIVYVKELDRIRVVIETRYDDGTTVMNPLEYAHVVLKVRINTEDLTSPWARSIFQDFLEQPYAQLISIYNKQRILTYLEQQVIYNKFGPNGANYKDSSFLFAYQFNEDDVIQSSHFKIPTIHNINRTWQINGRTIEQKGVPNDKLIIEPGFTETFVIVTQETGNCFEQLIHMDEMFTGILPHLWAKRVINDFLGTNTHLSTLDRESEWNQDAKDESNLWSDDISDTETNTPWRFFGRHTENMIEEDDQVQRNQWSDVDDNVRVNSEGLLKSDLNGDNGQSRVDNPRRMWGNNTEQIDSLFHRLIGSDKYTIYEEQYSEYNHNETTESWEPAGGSFVIETEFEVRSRYWKKFGLESSGLGSIGSDWLFPTWFARGYYGDYDGRDEKYHAIKDSRSGKSTYLAAYGTNYIHDNEGSIIRDSTTASYKMIFFMPTGESVPQGAHNQYAVKYKGDRLTITTPTPPVENVVWQHDSADNNRFHPSSAYLTDFLLSKNYAVIKSGYLKNKFPIPYLTGNFLFEVPRNFSLPYAWFLAQNLIPIGEADIQLGRIGLNYINAQTPLTFTNVSTSIGESGPNHNSLAKRLDIDLINCPNIVTIGYVHSDKIRVISCPSLTIIRVSAVADSNSKLILDEDSNGNLININANIVQYFAPLNCNLTSATIDKIIDAIHDGAVNNNNTGGFLRMDNYSSNGSQQTGLSPNAAPSSLNVNQSTNDVEPGSKLDELMNLYGWTVLWRDVNWTP